MVWLDILFELLVLESRFNLHMSLIMFIYKKIYYGNHDETIQSFNNFFIHLDRYNHRQQDTLYYDLEFQATDSFEKSTWNKSKLISCLWIYSCNGFGTLHVFSNNLKAKYQSKL